MIKLIACDLDDTLAPEIDFVKSGFNACSQVLEKKLGFDKDKIFNLFFNAFKLSKKNVFDRVLKSLNIENKDLLGELIATYRYHIPSINFYSDVADFLKIATEKNIDLAIITDGDAKTQKNKIKALNAQKYFKKIIATGDFGADFCKPSAKSFNMLISHFKISPENMIFIGDNPLKDFYISKSLPIKTARIIRENSVYKDAPYLSNVSENYRLSKLSDIFDFIL